MASNAPAGGQPQSQLDPIAMAQFEMKGLTNLFSNMSGACFHKCVTDFKEQELHVGEHACVDRCVTKYMQTTTTVSEYLARMNEFGPPPM